MSLKVDGFSNVKFQTPNFTSKEKMVDEPNFKCENNSNALKYSLVALGSIALGALGATMALKKGKVSELSEAAETLKKLKNIDVDAFKTVGKFEKGKATIDGKGFSGVIHTPNSKMTYENGNLLKSELADGKVKTYYRNDDVLSAVNINASDYEGRFCKNTDGSISITREMKRKNGSDRAVWYQTKVSADGKLSKEKIEQFNKSHKNYKEGKEQALRKTTDLLTGKSKVENRVSSSYFNPGYKEQIMVDGKKVSAAFNAKGEFRSAYSTTFNPETNIITKQHYEMKDGKLVPTNRFSQVDKNSRAVLGYEVGEDGKKTISYFSDHYHGAYNPKGSNWYDGSRCWNNPDTINAEIERMGLKFEL